MTQIVIALVGPKRCGKDTIAAYMSQYDYVNYKIAGRLKSACKVLFGFTDDEMETDAKDLPHPNWDVTPRHIMQHFGTEIMQYEIGKYIPKLENKRTFWMDQACNDILKISSNVVITDMRFIHEYNALKKQFANLITIKVTREVSACTSIDFHVSENEWKQIPCNFTVQNNSSIESLHHEIEALLSNQISKCDCLNM